TFSGGRPIYTYKDFLSLLKKALYLVFTILFAQNIFAQEPVPGNDLLTVYLDCRGCNSSFIRGEINFINFVRDQGDAEVHLIITRQGTASGGNQYTLNYIGREDLESFTSEIMYTSYDSDTEEEERNGLVRYVK